jgi:hypothetical protein
MQVMSDETVRQPAAAAAGEAEEFVCDFCGSAVSHVRRIALDRDYDRLQTPHQVQYACDACSAEKERQRKGQPPG